MVCISYTPALEKAQTSRQHNHQSLIRIITWFSEAGFSFKERNLKQTTYWRSIRLSSMSPSYSRASLCRYGPGWREVMHGPSQVMHGPFCFVKLGYLGQGATPSETGSLSVLIKWCGRWHPLRTATILHVEVKPQNTVEMKWIKGVHQGRVAVKCIAATNREHIQVLGNHVGTSAQRHEAGNTNVFLLQMTFYSSARRCFPCESL